VNAMIDRRGRRLSAGWVGLSCYYNKSVVETEKKTVPLTGRRGNGPETGGGKWEKSRKGGIIENERNVLLDYKFKIYTPIPSDDEYAGRRAGGDRLLNREEEGRGRYKWKSGGKRTDD